MALTIYVHLMKYLCLVSVCLIFFFPSLDSFQFDTFQFVLFVVRFYDFFQPPPPFFCFWLVSMPNLNSDLFDLQPAFIPAVQSNSAISNANSAWGGTLSAHIHEAASGGFVT